MRRCVYEDFGVRTLIGKRRLNAGGDMPGTPSHWLRNESWSGAIAVLILDGTGWHSSPKLELPANIMLSRLPPYAPELNPIECLGISP
jgi:hypothetical protein